MLFVSFWGYVIKSFSIPISFSSVQKFLPNFPLTCHLSKPDSTPILSLSQTSGKRSLNLRFPFSDTHLAQPRASGFSTAQFIASYFEFRGVATINCASFLNSLISLSLSCSIAHFLDPNWCFSRLCSWTSPLLGPSGIPSSSHHHLNPEGSFFLWATISNCLLKHLHVVSTPSI